MATVEERVAALEVRAGEQAVMMDGLREAVASLDRRVASLETRMDQRFTALEARMDTWFFAAMDARFASIDSRFTSIDRRFNDLDAKMSRQFLWILGAQIATFVAMIGTFLALFVAAG